MPRVAGAGSLCLSGCGSLITIGAGMVVVHCSCLVGAGASADLVQTGRVQRGAESKRRSEDERGGRRDKMRGGGWWRELRYI